MSFARACIVGPGAIGGMMAVRLQRAGYDVSALARPSRAARMTATGITLQDGGEVLTARPRVATTAAALGPQDLVIVTVKAGGLRAVVPDLAVLCGPATPLVFVMNGVPWWFLDGFGGALAGRSLPLLDPDGTLRRDVPASRLIWGVINCSVTELPDGTLVHNHSNHLQLGRPDGDLDGLEAVARVFRQAGYNTETTGRIRDAIWVKLESNITLNPISALTMAPLGALLGDDLVREAIIRIGEETQAVGRALGLATGPETRARFRDAPASAGASKTSMLQDAERGRPLEIDAVMGAVIELGDLLGIPMPTAKTVFGLARLRSQTLAGTP